MPFLQKFAPAKVSRYTVLVYTCTCMYMYTCTSACMLCTCTYMYCGLVMYIHTCTCACIHVSTHTHTQACAYIYMCTSMCDVCTCIIHFYNNFFHVHCPLCLPSIPVLPPSPTHQYGSPCIVGACWSRVPMAEAAHSGAVRHSLALLAQVRAWCQRSARCRRGSGSLSEQHNTWRLEGHHLELKLLL